MLRDLPEPYRTAMAAGRAKDVCDGVASTAEEQYARGLCRARVGRDGDARTDFIAALPAIGDACRLEIAFLDLRQRGSADAALATGRDVLVATPARTALRARALHVVGLAEGELRRSADATASLLEASEIFRELGERALRAQVLDTMGSVLAAQGRLDHALGHYALSLVEKTLLGDRYGVAITLGNIGRIHLREGRFHDALDCFETDLGIATQLGDERGRARAMDDVGRARFGLDDIAGAERDFRACIDVAAAAGDHRLEFFGRKDRARALIALGRLDESEAELDAAERLLADSTDDFLVTLVLAARGEWLLAKNDASALETLERAAKRFANADLPDWEIPTLIQLAQAYGARRLKAAAEECLRRALARAAHGGFARYLRDVREAMTKLSVVEGAIEETGRLGAQTDDVPPADGYVLLGSLGRGAFGEVFRAYDPRRSMVVALKRFNLELVYDPSARERAITSARMELEAASRIRHPGIARVHAVGTDSRGGMYVVQELVEGTSLRERMPDAPTANPLDVLVSVQRIANALEALHGHGIVHRDLKPGNIILRSPADSPVLVDFGIAYVPAFEDGFEEDAVVGTWEYMAPEQARGDRVGPKTDVYALGVILYEWLTGVRPLRRAGRETGVFVIELLKSEPPPIGDFRTDLDADVIRLVESLLRKRPKERPTASEVAAHCEWYLRRAG